MGGFFFSLPPTGSDLQCSASLLLRRFSQISESCFSSEPAGRQQSVESICSSLVASVIIYNIDLSLFSYFLDFEARNQQQHHRWKLNKLHHSTGRLLKTFSFHLHLLLPQRCVSMDCACIFLSDGLDCSSGFH